MAPILGPDGQPLQARGWYDTESLAEDGGTVYVGIERVNQIVRFDYRARTACARAAGRSRCRPASKRCRTTRASNAWRWRRKAARSPAR